MSVPVLSAAPALSVNRTREAVGKTGLVGATAVALIIVLGAAAGPSFLVLAGSDTTPGWLLGPLRGLGLPLDPVSFAVLMLLLVACALMAAWAAPALQPRAVAAAIIGVTAIFLLGPPLLTTDIFSYVAYGRLGALHGLDPYASAPIAFPTDAAYHLVGWRHARSAYGPLFTILSYGLAPLGVVAAVWGLKALAAASALVCVTCVWRLAVARGVDPRRAAVLVGLNPVFLVYAVGGGHNDLLMLAAMTAGAALIVEGRAGLGTATLVLAAGLKASAIVLVPFAVLGAGRRRSAMVGAAVATAATGAVSVLVFGANAGGFLHVLEAQQRAVSRYSVPDGLGDLTGSKIGPGMRLGLHVGFVVVFAGLLVWTWRGGDWIDAAAWALLAAAVATTWLMPWYTIWALPLAAVSRRSSVLVATLAVQLFLLSQILSRLA